MKIGFIGTGIMGSRMAANLLANGYDLAVHNRTREKADALVNDGAVWADTPADAAREVDVLFTVLAHPEAVEETAQDEGGFLDALPSGALWVDCSTVNPPFSRRMAAEALARGLRFLDAPVSGSKASAAGAKLTFIVGGDEADVEACRPLFAAMGDTIIHVGGHGMGISLKLVFNLLIAVSMTGFAEAIVLGQALGIPQERLFDTLMGSRLAPPFVSAKRENFERGEYEPSFPLKWMQKDLQMAAVAAYEAGAALPLANAAKEVYRLAMQAGLSEQDHSVIYAFLKNGSGAE